MIKYTPKLFFGPGLTDITDTIDPVRMREARAEKMRKVLRARGIPAIIVANECNVRYLLGFSWYMYQPQICYAIFFAEHEPVLFAHAGSYQVPEIAPHIKNWRPARATLSDIVGAEGTHEELDLMAKDIKRELDVYKLGKEKIAVCDFDDLTRTAFKANGMNFIDGWQLMLEASKCKTIDEINCLKMANVFCTVGWQTMAEKARPGMTPGQIDQIVNSAMAAAGAAPAAGGIKTGPGTFERINTYLNRIVESGDLCYYPLCGTGFMGYTACVYRSFKVGQKPTDKEKGWYNRVRDTLDAAIEATKIGNTTADAAKCFPPASKWGYKSEVEVLSIELGHGIGLCSPGTGTFSVHYNLPVINRQWSLKYPQPFEEGMVISYETCEGEHGYGGVRLEDTVLVTKDGPELLDFFPRDEITVAGLV